MSDQEWLRNQAARQATEEAERLQKHAGTHVQKAQADMMQIVGAFAFEKNLSQHDAMARLDSIRPPAYAAAKKRFEEAYAAKRAADLEVQRQGIVKSQNAAAAVITSKSAAPVLTPTEAVIKSRVEAYARDRGVSYDTALAFAKEHDPTVRELTRGR